MDTSGRYCAVEAAHIRGLQGDAKNSAASSPCVFIRSERYIMTKKLARTAMIIGALTLPVASYAADTATAAKPDTATAKPESPKTMVQDSMITAKIKAEFMKDPAVSALAIKVDTDD